MMPQRPVAIVQLLMFHASPDPEEPSCICSLCRLPFTTVNEAGETDWETPIRMWPEKEKGHGWEIRFHGECLEKVVAPGRDPARFEWRPDVHIAWAWGDDRRGKLLSLARIMDHGR